MFQPPHSSKPPSPICTLHGRGKVRDIYHVGDDLLIVATDRISAFDYVLGSGIPDKGKVLTQLSAFWFERMGDLVPNHLIAIDVDGVSRPRCTPHADMLRGRSMLVPPDRAGADRMRGARLPVGLGLEGLPADRQRLRHHAARRACANPIGCPSRSSRRRPRPRAATTSTSARTRPASIVGADLHRARCKQLTLELYSRGAAHAESSGIIIADTKFEFGLVGDGDPATDVVLIDEVLTPDSSRFWPRDQYEPGGGAAELRQAVRARLPRRDPVEQAAAGAVAARRRGRADAREIRRSVPPPHRTASSQ